MKDARRAQINTSSHAKGIVAIVVTALLAVACGRPSVSDVVPTDPSAAVDKTTNAAGDVESDAGPASRTPIIETDSIETLTTLLAKSSLERGLLLWGQQAVLNAMEAEYYERIEDMARAASTSVVAKILGPGPSRTVEGDPGTGDTVTYFSMKVEVLGVLSGHAEVEVGDTLIVETFRAPAEEGRDTIALLFLRDKQETRTGEPHPNARADEVGLYRIVSQQGVFIDRGDGVPINPLVEVARLVDSNADVTLDVFVFEAPPPDPIEYPVAAQARQVDMEELLQLVQDAGKG